MSDCSHDWHRDTFVERRNGPHVFFCSYCEQYGWRPRFRKNKSAPPDPIRVYGGKRQEIMRTRAVRFEPPTVTARPMSARRGANGGFVPPGSCGGSR